MKWRLYYENGSTFDDEDGAPHESPTWGVVTVVQPELRGNEQLMMNGDWVMWRTDLGQWTQCGDSGLDDHCVHFGHLIGCFRKTRWTHGTVHSGLYHTILARARNDIKASNG